MTETRPTMAIVLGKSAEYCCAGWSTGPGSSAGRKMNHADQKAEQKYTGSGQGRDVVERYSTIRRRTDH